MASTSGRALLLGGVVLQAAAARAGESPALREGARVRAVVLEDSRPDTNKVKRLTGTLVGIDDSTLRLQTSADQPPVVVARRDVTRVEVSLRPSRRRKGALIGFGVGAAAAIAMIVAEDTGAAQASCPPPPPGGFLFSCFDFNLFEGPEYDIAATLLLGAVGAGLGALVAPGEKWEAVPSERLSLAVGPTRGGGVKLGVSFRF